MTVDAVELRRYRNVSSGCELDGPLTEAITLKLEDNCSAIYGKFEISEDDPPDYNTLVRKFGNAQEHSGEISITNSNFEDLAFFRSLNNIHVYYNIYGKLQVLPQYV